MPEATPTEMLRISGLHAFYGESHILHGIDLVVGEGELVTLLGRNGAGRTTILKSIIGLVGSRTGSIKVRGVETITMPTHKIAHLGLGYCPEERGIFSSLTVQENLMLPVAVGQGGLSLPEIFEMFPNLLERRGSMGTRLSGGEQQMLAIGRALMTRPKLIMIDELSLGLMPKVIDQCYQALQLLRSEGMTVLLVEQNTERALAAADDVCVLESGATVWRGSAADARNDPSLTAAYLGLHAAA